MLSSLLINSVYSSPTSKSMLKSTSTDQNQDSWSIPSQSNERSNSQIDAATTTTTTQQQSAESLAAASASSTSMPRLNLSFEEKVFYREYAIGLYQLAQSALMYFQSDKLFKNQKFSLLGGFATFFIHKYLREGLRVNSLLLLLSEALIGLRQSRVVKVPYWAILSSIAAYLLSVKKLKVYTFPKPRGSYHVGYIHRVEEKLLSNPQEDLKYSVYYPCIFDASKSDQKWMVTENYWTRMHDTNMKDKERPGKVPKFFFKVQSSYLYKIQMGVLENAQLIHVDNLYYQSQFDLANAQAAAAAATSTTSAQSPKDTAIKLSKFPVVIISHGLAAHCNAYTLFAKELASHGYIVISMDHIEEIKNPHLDREENRVFRKQQLLHRLETSQKMLDLVYNGEYMKKLFNSEDAIPIDYNKISLLGHSFGGSTALYTAMNDQRVTGVVVGLDPCVYVYEPEEISLCEFPRPLLCIGSEDFYRRLYPWFQNDESLDLMFSNIKRFKESSINCSVKGAAHANQSDLAIVMAGEFDLYGITTRGECAKKHMFFNLMLFSYYFERYLIKGETELPKEQFLKDYFNAIGQEHKSEYLFTTPPTF